jgi:hypothetical protein
MGNPPWRHHHPGRHPAHTEVIDPRQLWRHWRHLQWLSVKLWRTHHNCYAMHTDPNLFLPFYLFTIYHRFTLIYATEFTKKIPICIIPIPIPIWIFARYGCHFPVIFLCLFRWVLAREGNVLDNWKLLGFKPAFKFDQFYELIYGLADKTVV